MITTRRIVIPVTTLFLALVALAGAPSALAIRPDPAFDPTSPLSGSSQTVQAPTQVIHHGTSLWTIALVIAVTICLTLLTTVAAQTLHRRHSGPPAQLLRV
jgi:ABC-type dipeptide/oligopeptide/nickel transport system permease subunit